MARVWAVGQWQTVLDRERPLDYSMAYSCVDNVSVFLFDRSPPLDK